MWSRRSSSSASRPTTRRFACSIRSFIFDDKKSVAQAVKEAEGKVGAPIQHHGLRALRAGRGDRPTRRRFCGRGCGDRRPGLTPAGTDRTMAEPAYRRVIVKCLGRGAGRVGRLRHQSGDRRSHRRRPGGCPPPRRGARGGGRRRQHPARRARLWRRPAARHRRFHGDAGDRGERARARGGDRAGRAAPARSMSASSMPQVCETYERQRALRHLADGRIVLFAGGTGNPFFTTDTTAVLRAAEMGCQARAQGHQRRRGLFGRSQGRPQCPPLRQDHASGGDRRAISRSWMPPPSRLPAKT